MGISNSFNRVKAGGLLILAGVMTSQAADASVVIPEGIITPERTDLFLTVDGIVAFSNTPGINIGDAYSITYAIDADAPDSSFVDGVFVGSQGITQLFGTVGSFSVDGFDGFAPSYAVRSEGSNPEKARFAASADTDFPSNVVFAELNYAASVDGSIGSIAFEGAKTGIENGLFNDNDMYFGFNGFDVWATVNNSVFTDAVPESSTYALLAGSAALVAVGARRRKKPAVDNAATLDA